MKKFQKLEYLKDNYFGIFFKTRKRVKEDLSEGQTMFCCCGKLATGLHEDHCRKFNDKVDAETIKRLQYLLSSKRETK